MRFFQKIINGYRRMMYGRNGHDRLCSLLKWVYLALWIVSIVTSAFDLVAVSLAVWGLQVAVLGYWVFRVFSRNIVKRRHEVDRFYGFFRSKRNRFRDRRTHVYRRCPHCKAVLRLPKRKGKHTVCCPACKERFSVKICRNGKNVK